MEDKIKKTPVRRDIMEKPLPEILDEIDTSIGICLLYTSDAADE